MAVFSFMILQTAHWPKLDFEMNEIQQSKEKPNKQMFRTWRSALWVPCLSCDCSSWWSFGSVFCPAGSFATATAATAGTRFAPVWFFVWFPFYHLPFPLKRTEEKKRRQTLELSSCCFPEAVWTRMTRPNYTESSLLAIISKDLFHWLRCCLITLSVLATIGKVWRWSNFFLSFHVSNRKVTHPRRHFVHIGTPVVVIQHHHGQHHRRSHHEHDTIKVGSCRTNN